MAYEVGRHRASQPRQICFPKEQWWLGLRQRRSSARRSPVRNSWGFKETDRKGLFAIPAIDCGFSGTSSDSKRLPSSGEASELSIGAHAAEPEIEPNGIQRNAAEE
ncbi:hypothetical protein TNCV_226481 [Trichonephila clavipes]|nr:hypothetical protein TNCV_226481 [Trichonephila clavipes]